MIKVTKNRLKIEVNRMEEDKHDIQGKRVLVTGGAGFIGSNVV